MTKWLNPAKSGQIYRNSAGRTYTGTASVPVFFEDADAAGAIADGWTYSPTATLEPEGKQIPVPAGYSTDSSGNVTGLVGPSGLYNINAPTFVPKTNDYAGIIAAYNACVAAGGGTVQLLPVTYNIGGNTLPISSKITYRGAGFQLSYTGIPDSPFTDVVSGTIILGNGTAAGFSGNATDYASTTSSPLDGTQTTFANLGITNCGIFDLAIKNCTYGVKIGGNYGPGCFYSNFKNIVALKCTSWGVWFENCQHNHYDIYSIGNTAGQMQFRFSCTTSILAPGNSTAGELNATCPANLLSKGIEVSAINGTGGGISSAQFVQCNRFNNPTFTPVSAVCNGTANVTVPDGTKFAVDLPVAFTAVAGTGWQVGYVYFVTSVVGNVIQMATSIGGSPLSPSAGTATLTTQGFAPLTMVGYPGATNIASIGFIGNLDLESGGTTKLMLQSAGNHQTYMLGGIGHDASSTVDICLRSLQYCVFVGDTGLTWDMDSVSATNIDIGGIGGTFKNSSAPTKLTGLGINELNLAAYTGTDGLSSLISRYATYADWTYPGRPIGQHQSFSTSTALTVNLSSALVGVGTYTGTGAATWTWGQGLGAIMQGFRQTFKNQGTGALTITLSATDGTFDGLTGGVSLGKSFLLAAPTTTALGGCITMVCSQIGATTYQWEVESIVNATLV